MDALIKRGAAICSYSGFKRTAFTLIELLVVIATSAVLAVFVLPALAGTQAQSKTTACTARFRQWAASANLYANDNRGWLPTANPAGGGAYAWDVGTKLPNMLFPYGMDVPVWFCPVRPAALDVANAWAQMSLGHPLQNTNDLRLYWSGAFVSEITLNDNYWVPRTQVSQTFPVDFSGRSQFIWPAWLRNEPTPTSAIYGWPQRLHDRAVPYVPFISDTAASGHGSGLQSPQVGAAVSYLSPNTAHFANGRLMGVNCSYADGHVAGHTPDQMLAVYYDSANYWFY